jgi:hypothetical protein
MRDNSLRAFFSQSHVNSRSAASSVPMCLTGPITKLLWSDLCNSGTSVSGALVYNTPLLILVTECASAV